MPASHKSSIRFKLTIIAVTVFALLLPFFNAPQASALIYNDMGAEQEAESWWRYKAVEKCMNLGLASQWHYDEANLTSGAWWDMGDEKVFGGFMRDIIPGIDGDFSKECKTTPDGILQTSLTFWGIESGLNLLCGEKDSGGNDADRSDNIVNRADDEDCFTGNTDFDYSGIDTAAHGRIIREGPKWSVKKELVMERISDAVYNGDTPSDLAGAPRYYYYWQTFLKSCAYGATSTPTKPNGPSNKVYEIAEWNADVEEMQTAWYTGDKARDVGVKAWPGGSQMTCGEMADAIKDPDSGLALLYGGAVKSGSATGTAGVDTSTSGDAVSSCAIEGIGWIICPVINFMADVADNAYSFLANNFLSIPTGFLRMDDTNATYTTWQRFVSVANVLFVIGFLIIIFSQLTGLGVSNYGIKKLLPKLIVGIILINLSFIICAVAVDVSNVVGYSINSFLANIAGSTGDADIGARAAASATGEGWRGIAGVVLGTAVVGGAAVAASGGVTLALIALIGVLVSAVIALVMIFFMLQIRQALIILLIIVSPIAFAAYLLPNTAQWFTKWRKTFTALLLLFPIIGLVFGASSLASTVITDVYTSAIAEGTVGDTTGKLGSILGAAIMVLPLFVVPSILKKSLDSVGSIGGKMTALGSKLGGGARKSIGDSQFSKFQKGLSAQRAAQVRAGKYNGSRLNPATWASGVNKRVNDGKSNFGKAFNKATGGYGTSRGRSADKWEGQEIRDRADAMAGYLDETTRLPMDPTKLFDDMLTRHTEVTNDPKSTEKQIREARINLAASQQHLMRTNGQAGAEHARTAIAASQAAQSANTGAATPNPSATARAQAATNGAGGGTGATTGAPAGAGAQYRTNAAGAPIRPSGSTGQGGSGAYISADEQSQIDAHTNALGASQRAYDDAIAAGLTPEEAQRIGGTVFQVHDNSNGSSGRSGTTPPSTP